MNWVLKRFRVVISIALILSTVSTYLIVYLPRRDTLEYTALNDFVSIASANEHTFNQSISYALAIAENLSNIEDLSQLILSYNQGLTTYDTLRAETQTLFRQFVQNVPFIISALRVVDNMLIGSYGTVEYDKIVPDNDVDEIYYEFECVDCEMTIYAPIYYEDTIIGLDITVFDLSDSITTLDYENYDYTLIQRNGVGSDEEHLRIVDVEGTKLFDDGEYIYYRNPIDYSDILFQVAVDRDVLLTPTRRITARSLLIAIICNVTLLLLTNIIFIRIARHRFKQIERRKDLYKEYAYKDTLTGAFSRLYMERWIYAYSNNSKFIHEDICVVMLDINNYKALNDTRGHHIGDRVLQYTVNYIKDSINDQDLVVRYGGDEFIIILLNTQLEKANSVLATIAEKLSFIKELQLGISVSHGIEQVSSYDSIFDAIEKADEKMYISKDKYKQSLFYNPI